MATEVKIPPMGESITSGVLSAWHVKDGDIVTEGQILFELETDKISSEGTAEVGGKITLQATEGAEVEIGQVVALIDASVSAPASSTPQEPTSHLCKEDNPLSPAVKKMAEETSIDPSNLQGSGKGGRVTKGDMLNAQKVPTVTPTSTKATPTITATPTGDRFTTRKMTPLRRKIAERLVAAQHEAASLTTFNEVDMKPIMDLRKQYQESFVKKYNIKLGFMSFFVKAVVHALKEVPAMNAQINGDSIIENHFYDISIAVGGPKGLIVPVVRNCDQLGFHEIEQSIADCAQRARDGKIGLEELEGGVFTITNGGIYGSMLSTPILNPPQSGILGMHSIKERAVVVNGEITIRPMMYLALTYDHRVVDGKEAVTTLVKIKEALEDPTRLLFNI